MFEGDEPTWMDQDSSWWAKANRAKEHIDSLRRQVDEYRASAPYSLTPELTEEPSRLAYRLRFLKPVPVAISTTVGDVLHNLRAALESLAFEVARRGQGGTLTAKQEKESRFPICRTPEALDDFFTGRRKKGLLYDHRARAAFRSVQPFVNLAEAQKLGVALNRSFEEAFRWSVLHRLDALWNVDKHRRLTLMRWWPDLIFWGSNGPSNRSALPGDGTLADGSIVAIQRERNGVVAGQRERSRDRVARAEVDGTPSASARAERGRQPRPGGEQLPQRLQLVHAPLGSRRQVGLHHGEVGQPLQGAPAPTRGALLDLDWPDVPLRLIVGERHRKVGRKPQDHRLVLLEAARQPQPVGGRPGPLALVGDDPGRDRPPIP